MFSRILKLLMDLSKWLEHAEIRFRQVFGGMPTPLGGTGDIQVYAYHEKHTGTGLPVVCIGGNYSQGSGKNESGCSANLSRWVRNYCKMRSVFERQPKWIKEWVAHEWSSPRFPRLPAENEMFFVMTNLCPWITKEAWSETNNEQIDDMLRASKINSQYSHIEELISTLISQEREFALVGHGISENAAKCILGFLRGRERWVHYANLTYSHFPDRWDCQHERFIFSSKLEAAQTISSERATQLEKPHLSTNK